MLFIPYIRNRAYVLHLIFLFCCLLFFKELKGEQQLSQRLEND